MENIESTVTLFDMARDILVLGGLLGLAGVAVWMLPWSNADLDEAQGELRSVATRLLGKSAPAAADGGAKLAA